MLQFIVLFNQAVSLCRNVVDSFLGKLIFLNDCFQLVFGLRQFAFQYFSLELHFLGVLNLFLKQEACLDD